MSDSEYEKQLVALLANDELGLNDWSADIDPILMEKWANRFDMTDIPVEREEVVDLVVAISTLGYIPLLPVWEQVYAKEGIAPVVWTVGAQNGKRVIKFKICLDHLPATFGESDLRFLVSDLGHRLKAEIELADVDDWRQVTFRW